MGLEFRLYLMDLQLVQFPVLEITDFKVYHFRVFNVTRILLTLVAT